MTLIQYILLYKWSNTKTLRLFYLAACNNFLYSLHTNTEYVTINIYSGNDFGPGEITSTIIGLVQLVTKTHIIYFILDILFKQYWIVIEHIHTTFLIMKKIK